MLVFFRFISCVAAPKCLLLVCISALLGPYDFLKKSSLKNNLKLLLPNTQITFRNNDPKVCKKPGWGGPCNRCTYV